MAAAQAYRSAASTPGPNTMGKNIMHKDLRLLIIFLKTKCRFSKIGYPSSPLIKNSKIVHVSGR